MEWVFSNFHTTSEHGVPSITTADAHTSAASSRLNRRPCRSKWTRPFRRKEKSGFCACAITFQTQSTNNVGVVLVHTVDQGITLVITLGENEYKRNWIQHVNRMPRNRLPRIMKHYSPSGRRKHGRSLKRLLDT